MSEKAPAASGDSSTNDRARRARDAREGAQDDDGIDPDKAPRKSTHGLAAYVERAPSGTNMREILEAMDDGIPPHEVWPDE